VNFYGFLADLMTLFHLCYMSYIVFGQLLVLVGWPLGWKWIRNPWFRLSHLGLILIVVGEASIGMNCPLTDWENDLRELAGQKFDYEGRTYRDISFTGRMLRNVQFAAQDYWEAHINEVFYAAGGVVLGTFLLVPPRFRRSAPAAAPVKEPEPATTTSEVTAVSKPPA
jgi:hypothetical protein